MRLSVNIREVVEFYDSNRFVRRHSNAIKTLAHEEFAIKVLLDFFNKRQQPARNLGIACTAKDGGAWLDAWVEVAEQGSTVHYQVEVKGWSFHGYGGGTSLPWDCATQPLSEFMRKEFLRYWDAANGRFRAPGLDKVLKEMKTTHDGGVRPLACLWAPYIPWGKLMNLFSALIPFKGRPLGRFGFFLSLLTCDNSYEVEFLTFHLTSPLPLPGWDTWTKFSGARKTLMSEL